MVIEGDARGPIIALREPLSFWGGLDAATGRVMDRWHPDHDADLSGRLLVMERGRGSSSGASVLAEAIRLGTAPAAILMHARDPIVTIGALVAIELYGKVCPIALIEDEVAFRALAAAPAARLAGTGPQGLITLSDR
jgi:hypothetical protein